MTVSSNLTETHVYRNHNGELQFLVLLRSETEIYPNLWQMITGSIHQGEKAYQTAVREVKEETGLLPKKLWIVPNINSYYESETNETIMIPVFLVRVDDNVEVKLSHEHKEYKWTDAAVAKSLFSWPGQIRSLEIIEEFLFKKNLKLKFVEIKI